MTAGQLVATVGRWVFRGLQDLGRCHLLADWTVFVDPAETTESKENADVRHSGLG